MLLDLVFGFILVLMAGVGAYRGAMVSGAGLGSLLVGYLAGGLAALHGGDWVARQLVVSPLVAPAIAGTLGFALAYIFAGAVAGVMIAWDRERTEDFGRGWLDRAFGSGFGFARGALIVVLLAVMTNWLDAARDLGAIEGFAAVPQTESSRVAGAAGGFVESAMSKAFSDAGPAGEVMARITARPGETLGSMQALIEADRLGLMFQDRFFWTLVQNGSIDHAMNREAVRSLVNDPEMRERFADLGLVEDTSREDRSAFRAEMATMFKELAPRVNQLHNDPEILELAHDPEIVQLLESGDTFGLISHPRLKRIVERVSRDL